MIVKKIFFLYLLLFGINSCKKDGATLNNNVNTGSSGSTARFAIVGNTLYTVSLTNLNIFDIADKNNPTLAGTAKLGVDIETVFPRDEATLFVGSSTGMYIFDITNRLLPNLLAFYRHFTSCDPVVADQNYAYLTLSSKNNGRRCIRGVNELEVIDLSDIRNPQLVKTLPMYSPAGLALDKHNLFVCDNGLKWFDVTYPLMPVLKKNYLSIQANDLIVADSILMAIGEAGLEQYKVTADSIFRLSTIPVVKN